LNYRYLSITCNWMLFVWIYACTVSELNHSYWRIFFFFTTIKESFDRKCWQNRILFIFSWLVLWQEYTHQSWFLKWCNFVKYKRKAHDKNMTVIKPRTPGSTLFRLHLFKYKAETYLKASDLFYFSKMVWKKNQKKI
jgi:hypothetical protein